MTRTLVTRTFRSDEDDMTPRNLTNLFFSVICLACGSFLSATALRADGLSADRIKEVAIPLVDDKILRGVSIGFIDGDQRGSVHLGSVSSTEDRRPDNDTVYEIGSITKVFTGLLLADAVVAGKLQMDDPASHPRSDRVTVPARGEKPVTWRHLSTHRSGLPRLATNMSMKDPSNPYADYGAREAAAFLREFRPSRSPGEQQEYSNFGVSLLGYLLSQHAEKSYEALVRDEIGSPLGMDDLTVGLRKDQTSRAATGHANFEDPTNRWDFADMPGAGGLNATIDDMMAFAAAHLDAPEGPLGEAIELAWRVQSESGPGQDAMGLGWFVAGDGSTRWHNGGTGGFRSMIMINRELDAAVVVLSNTADDSVDGLAGVILRMAAGVAPPAARVADGAASEPDAIADAGVRKRLEGRYRINRQFVFTVRDRGGRLMVTLSGQQALQVFPESPTKWNYRDVEASLEFELPAKGPATALTLFQNGIRQRAVRIAR